jgi:hypothetical protein
VNLNSIDKPSPQATIAEVTVASVKNKAEIKVIMERIITNINASG